MAKHTGRIGLADGGIKVADMGSADCEHPCTLLGGIAECRICATPRLSRPTSAASRRAGL